MSSQLNETLSASKLSKISLTQLTDKPLSQITNIAIRVITYINAREERNNSL